ncbi:hypothetical protein GmHk_06G015373 [Glycine max]|nr:hypothetical protein GmHk_06G015373 [Glycine max]
MAVTVKLMALIVSFFGLLSFILGVIAENKKPPAGMPVPVKDGVTCKFSADLTLALGYLSVIFLIASTVVGYLSLFYPYKGKAVPQRVLFKSTTFMVFFNVALFPPLEPTQSFLIHRDHYSLQLVLFPYGTQSKISFDFCQPAHSILTVEYGHFQIPPPIAVMRRSALISSARVNCVNVRSRRFFLPCRYQPLFSTGLALTMLLWPTITEHLHLKRNVHHDLTYTCPTAKTGLLGGGAFLSLDSSLFWLVALMLADNAREDFLDEDKDVELPSHVNHADMVI